MSKNINLQQYLGREIPCSCGRNHSTTLDALDIDRGAADRLPEYIRKKGWKKVYMVADINTWEAAGKDAADKLEKAGIAFEKYILPYRELVPDEKPVGEVFIHCPKDADIILAVGSGTINDMCKFISAQMKLDYIILASAPSMDGFVSVGAALIVDHVKTTYDAHCPIAVFGDPDVLVQAPMDMISAGLADILGKYTCLLDWKMAHLINDEYYCEEVVAMVENALEIVTEQGPTIKDRNPEAAKAVMEALVLTGMGMFFIGNSRPASGCEHHMSHYWEMKFQMEGKKPVLHGTKVGINMIAATYMYRMLAKEDIDFDAAMARPFDYEAWKARVERCYEDAAPGIIALEEKCKKNDISARNQRLAFYKDHWSQMQAMIEDNLPQVKDMENLLQMLGGPINPAQIGVSSEMVEDGVVLAKEVRDRFTLLQILWDLGLSEDYGHRLAVYFSEEQGK